MEHSRDHRILVHEDQTFFREAVLFTAGQTGLNATLIEKDYFCTVLLKYLYDQPDSTLIFRGGTCIGKVYAAFYRLSEDLDFLISTPFDPHREPGEVAPHPETSPPGVEGKLQTAQRRLVGGAKGFQTRRRYGCQGLNEP